MAHSTLDKFYASNFGEFVGSYEIAIENSLGVV